MARRKRCNWMLVGVLLILGATLIGYVVGVPAIATWLAPAPAKLWKPVVPPLFDQIWIQLSEFLVFVWVFMLGASVGSFLNVVVYRTPRGMSLLGSSKCPFCRTPIRSRDNVPVFGWIVLRGRCRTCHLPISPRYPLVEFTAGCLLLVLAVLEVLLAGVNLPTFDAHGHAIMGLRWFVAHPRWDLVATGGYHAFLLCNLLSWALIEHDGHAIPKRLVMLAVAVAVLAPVACPWVQPILWMAEKPVWIAQQPWLNRVDTSLVGLAAGHVVGWAASLSSIPRDTFQSRTWDLRLGVMAGFSVVGAALGWQALLSVALVASGLRLAVSARRRQDMHRSSPTLMLLCLGLATLVQVCFWRGLDGWAWWPGSHATALAAIIAVLMLAELLWLGGVLDRRTLALLERGQGEVMETLAPLGRGQGEGASVAPDTDRAFQQPHQAEHSGQQNQAEEQ